MYKQIKLGRHHSDIYAILANFSTICNLLLGLIVIISVLFHQPNFSKIFLARLIVLAASFDAVDGKMARRSKTTPHFGVQFDTSADLFSFALAPATMVLSLFSDKNWFIAVVLAIIYLFTASFRLSRFMYDPTTSKMGYFKGMPSPVSAIFVSAWYIQPSVNLYFAAFFIVLTSGAMISSLPYTGMRKVKTIPQKVYTFIAVSLMLLYTYSPNYWMITVGKAWIVYLIYFLVVGPFHAYATLVKEEHYSYKY